MKVTKKEISTWLSKFARSHGLSEFWVKQSMSGGRKEQIGRVVISYLYDKVEARHGKNYEAHDISIEEYVALKMICHQFPEKHPQLAEKFAVSIIKG